MSSFSNGNSVKNSKPSSRFDLKTLLNVAKVSFLGICMASAPMVVKPAFASAYQFIAVVLPGLCRSFSTWLTPTFLHVILNCIILTIVAISSLPYRFSTRGSPPAQEFNPSTDLHQKLDEEQESLTERSTLTVAEQEVSSVRRRRDDRHREKARASSRFAHHRFESPAEPNPESESLRIARSSRGETLEATWKAITEGRRPPLARHLRKSETWDTAPRGGVSPPRFRKSETLSRTQHLSAELQMRREPSLSQDDLNQRVEAFIAKVNRDMRLQREESLVHYMEMVNRGAG